MSASKLLVYRMPASRAQLVATSSVALALFAMFISTLFFRTELFQTQQMPAREAFVAISSIILVMADLIIATLLFAQAQVLRARPLYVLAAGYFFAGAFLTLRVLSLPGALGMTERRTDPHYNVPLWFYLSSHVALPLAIMAYAWLSKAPDRLLQAETPGHHLPGRIFAGAMILAGCVVVALTVTETSLPWSSPIFLTAVAVMLLVLTGMGMLGYGAHSELDLWLLLMLWGWFLELALIGLSSTGYTAGWYAARTLGMLSGLFVLFALLAESSKLYAQTVLRLIAQTQEREHRFLIRDVMSASIAHELRQPLSAILINAQTARKIASNRPDLPKEQTIEVLEEIIQSSLRANGILESTRAMFGRANDERRQVDPIMVLQRTLAMVESSARAQNVSVKLVVEGQLGPVAVNLLQFQQALLNLFQNAIEALSQSGQRRRLLLVRCGCWEEQGVVIRVEDNGPGIPAVDRTRIFDAFFTTRPEATGMGLLIARSVIRAHGGRLEVEPRSPTGTVFVIRLPYGEQKPDWPIRSLLRAK
jgi:signal transduction histidine kinase